ncbi:MAG TPA: FxsA family protein [Azospirillaceae bacterium]|nr:FxsA family protein [Azospirillaceae bacterium]
MRILPLLVLLPLLEIAGFIWVGGAIGAGPTLALIVLAAVAGVWLIRRQGLSTLRAAATDARSGAPLQGAFDGLCLALAGVLLFIPGFLSDLLALPLLLPPVRRAMLKRLGGGFVMAGAASGGFRPQRPAVIEGDFVEVREPAVELPPEESRWRAPNER